MRWSIYKTLTWKQALLTAGLFLLFASCFDSDDGDFDKQLKDDLAAIDQYLSDNSITALKDSTKRIRFVIHKHGTGDIPTLDSCISANFLGKILSTDKKFTEGSGNSFPLRGNLIEGWKLGIPLLHNGDSVTFYIPSGLAYGTSGIPQEGIDPNSNVLFHFKLIRVGKSYTATPVPIGSCN